MCHVSLFNLCEYITEFGIVNHNAIVEVEGDALVCYQLQAVVVFLSFCQIIAQFL